MQNCAPDNLAVRRVGWMAALTATTVVTSFVLACATPFAALAAVAALIMNRRDAFIATAATWVATQAVGYGLLHYPHTWNSVGWGIAIGLGAMIATAVAAGIGRALRPVSQVFTVLASFAAAFVSFEITLYAATFVLSSDSSAFSLAIVLYILKVNVIAFGGLLVLQYFGRRTGLALPQWSPDIAPTPA